MLRGSTVPDPAVSGGVSGYLGTVHCQWVTLLEVERVVMRWVNYDRRKEAQAAAGAEEGWRDAGPRSKQGWQVARKARRRRHQA